MTIAEFNYLESLLWFCMGNILFFLAVRQGVKSVYFVTLTVSSMAFFVFAITDIAEATTGAWWRPIELFVVKALCVFTFLWCYLSYRKIKAGRS